MLTQSIENKQLIIKDDITGKSFTAKTFGEYLYVITAHIRTITGNGLAYKGCIYVDSNNTVPAYWDIEGGCFWPGRDGNIYYNLVIEDTIEEKLAEPVI